MPKFQVCDGLGKPYRPAEHGCSYGEPGGFLRRLSEDEGTWMGHILEHINLELQQLAGANVTFGKTRGTGKEGCYHVVYSYEEERVGLEAAKLGLALIEDLLPEDLCPEPRFKDAEFDFQTDLEELIGLAQRRHSALRRRRCAGRGRARHPLDSPE